MRCCGSCVLFNHSSQPAAWRYMRIRVIGQGMLMQAWRGCQGCHSCQHFHTPSAPTSQVPCLKIRRNSACFMPAQCPACCVPYCLPMYCLPRTVPPQGYSYSQWEQDVRRWEQETGMTYEQYTRMNQPQLQAPQQQPRPQLGMGGRPAALPVSRTALAPGSPQGQSPSQPQYSQQQQQQGYGSARSPMQPMQQQFSAQQPQYAPLPPQQQQQQYGQQTGYGGAGSPQGYNAPAAPQSAARRAATPDPRYATCSLFPFIIFLIFILGVTVPLRPHKAQPSEQPHLTLGTPCAPCFIGVGFCNHTGSGGRGCRCLMFRPQLCTGAPCL